MSDEMINAAIFSLAYAKGVPYRLMDTWPSEEPRSRSRIFATAERHPGFDLSLPRVRYNNDLLGFYQLAISSEIPELQYLAFYQVLEYFFVTVSDEALYARLRTRLASPVFRPVAKYLDPLIQDVVNHGKMSDEGEMLKLVIEKYLIEAELMAFISRYEDFLNDRWYTKRRERFGVDTEVKLQPGHVFGNVAKVLRTVRNALVHSSDRFERLGRHIPFSASSDLVRREIPLVKYVAEQVIIASAESVG